MNLPLLLRWLRWAWPLMAVPVLLAVLAGITIADNAAYRGIVFEPQPQPIPYTEPAAGVNVFNLHLEPDPAAVRRTFELARDLGVGYVRMQVPWEDIEIHGPGDFSDRRNVASIGVVSAWDKYDRIVAEAQRAEIELIMRLDRPPDWARPQAIASPEFQDGLAEDGNSTGPPDDYADFGRFVETIVRRYQGQVRFFQIWNEPNLKNEWNWQEPQPEAFLELLQIAHAAAQRANPEAVILFPGLAPTDGLDKRAPMSELEYLDRIYQAGGADAFDIMAAQSYGLGQPPTENRYIFLRNRSNWNWLQPIDTRNDVSRVVLLREVMERHGDHNKPVWVTEFGWNSAPETIPPERRFVWGEPVDEATKGAYLAGQIERARREWPWLGVMNVWMLRYGGYAEPDPNDPTPYFALVSRDWQILDSYRELQAYLNQPATAGVGSHTWAHPAVSPVEGGWQVRFAGEQIELVGGLDGAIEVSLDGEAISLIRDGQGGRQTLATPQLSDDTHTLVIRGAPAPEHFRVSRTPPPAWLWSGSMLLVIGLLAVSTIAAVQRLYPAADQLIASYQRQRPPTRTALLLVGMLLALLLAYRASAQLPLTALGLLIFGGLALIRPDLALLWVPLTIPFYFIPKGIFDARFGIRDSGVYLPIHEIVLLISLSAVGVRWIWGQVRPTRPPSVMHDLNRRSRTDGLQTLAPQPPRPRAGVGEPRSGGDAGTRLQTFAPIGLFLLAGIWGLLIAGERGPALRELRWMVVEPLLFVGMVWLVGVPGSGLRPTASRDPYLLTVVQAWLIGGAISALIGLLQFGGLNLAPLFGTKAGFSDDSMLVEGVRRVSGLYGHPNNLGLAMGRYWPLAVALGAGTIGVRRNLYLSLALLCLGALAVSFSRGAYLGVLAGGLTLAILLLPGSFWRRREVWIGLVLLGLIGLGGALLLALNVERLNPFGETTTIRLKTWASALAMLRDHPLGIGLDQFGRLYPDYIDPSLAGTNEIHTAHPHNLLLDLALRMGPLGLVAFGWLSVRMLHVQRPPVETQHIASLPAGAAMASLPAGAVAALVAALVHGMVDAFYFWPDLALAFWLLYLAATSRAAKYCGSTALPNPTEGDSTAPPTSTEGGSTALPNPTEGDSTAPHHPTNITHQFAFIRLGQHVENIPGSQWSSRHYVPPGSTTS
jgi:O-antigen ligase